MAHWSLLCHDRRWFCRAAVFFALVALSTHASAQTPPADNDYSAPALRAYETQLLAPYGGDYRLLPLAAKAEHFEWALWRYHLTPWLAVLTTAELPPAAGALPVWHAGADSSTWMGALLAALSYKYAVTRDGSTLEHIVQVLRGLHLHFEVTGVRGHLARAVVSEASPRRENMALYVAPDGARYVYIGGPAKGTYNQVAQGYAVCMMLAYDALPPEAQQLIRGDLTAMVLHLIDHDYRLTGADGQPTPYGDLTPLLGSQGVPFNAQVAYLIVALGHYHAAGTPDEMARIETQFRRLRDRHHVYYEHPLRSVVQPQKIGASPLVKGMNDRQHVTTAAYVGLLLDLHAAAWNERAWDADFVHQLGQTLSYSMDYLRHERNALLNFQWGALIDKPAILATIVEHRPNTVHARMEQGLLDGVEQLRRFRLDRFLYEGVEGRADAPVWIDQFKPDAYHWKCDPTATYQVTGPPTPKHIAAIDYLHAYWLMRHFHLDRHPTVQKHHAPVLP